MRKQTANIDLSKPTLAPTIENSRGGTVITYTLYQTAKFQLCP